MTEALHDRFAAADLVVSGNSSWRTAIEAKLALMSTALEIVARDAERAPASAADSASAISSLAAQIAALDRRCVGLEDTVRGLTVTAAQSERAGTDGSLMAETLGVLVGRLDRLEESLTEADLSEASRRDEHQGGHSEAATAGRREMRSLLAAELAGSRAADATSIDEIRTELADMRQARDATDQQLRDILGLLSTSLARVVDHLEGPDGQVAAATPTPHPDPESPTAMPEERAAIVEPVSVDDESHASFALVGRHSAAVDAFSPPALRGFAVPPRRPSFLQTLTGFGLRKVA